MRYRAEIDGLRAISVVAVILFHAGFAPFKGGFVGVDIFFVISGYLIATATLTDLQRGSFSLADFYERRARRILPALFLVLLVCVGLAWFWLRPADMQNFAHSLVAVPYFVSNIWYWSEAGYWDTASELKPLLHTWALAIEAQFYITFPLMILGIWRFGRRWLLPLVSLAGLLSFAIAQWSASTFPSANFYLLQSRLWEFIIGVVIGIFLLNRKPPTYRQLSYQKFNDFLIREISGFIGLFLIFLSIVKLHGDLPYPSAFALMPTVGTGLILAFASSHTLTGRLLSTPALVNIGLISYGAYLWHHPLFAFARHRSLARPSPQIFAALIVFSFLLAYLTWRYVERPFRKPNYITRKAFFLFWLMGSLLFIEVGVVGHLTSGFSDRAIAKQFSQNQLAQILPQTFINQIKQHSVVQLLNENAIVQLPLDTLEQPINTQTMLPSGFGLGPICDGAPAATPECRTHENPEILLWGDSFAMQLAPSILASNPEVKMVQITKSVCGPFFDVAPISEPNYPVRWAKECLAFNQQVREWLRQNTVKYAVLASPFSQYLLTDEKVLLRNEEVVKANFDLAIREFEKTLTELKELGIDPIIVSPPPTNDLDLGQCVARAEWMGLPQEKCNFLEDHMSLKRVSAYQFIDVIQQKFRVLRLEQLMCHSQICTTYAENTPLYRDARHLSDAGAALLGRQHNFYGIITGK